MIIPPRRYLALAIAAFLTVAGLRLGAAIWADPFADFYFLTGLHTATQHSVENFTERKIKRRLVEDTPAGAISAAIFGNSRAAALDPGEGPFAAAFPGALNLAFSGADMAEITATVDLALRRHPGLRPVVGLDLDECYRSANTVSGPVLYISPEADDRARRDSLARLSALSALFDWGRSIAAGHGGMSQDILANGAVRRSTTESARQLRAEQDRFIYGGWFRRPYDPTCADKVRRLRALAPQAIFLVNPLSPVLEAVLAEAGGDRHRQHFRAAVAGLGPILDFGCRHPWQVTDFHDGHHYRAGVAQAILDDVAAFAGGATPRHACVIN